MRIVIIGAVAAGTSAAAKARRNSESADIVVYEKDSFISYSGCGMPYYIGGVVTDIGHLIPRDTEFFRKKYNVDILTRHEVLSVNPKNKTLTVKKIDGGEIFTDSYDKLIFATGAKSNRLPIKGGEANNVFYLRNIGDMNAIKGFINGNKPQTAAIIGTGYIGLEVCENLKKLGISVTLIEKQPQIAPNLDADMAAHVMAHIEKNGVDVICGAEVEEISGGKVYLFGGRTADADIVIIAAGVSPETTLAVAAGVKLGTTGAISVDKKMQTSVPDIYACGDCIEQFHVITGAPVYRPLGTTANKTGRIAGDCVTGGDLEFKGVLGTGIFRIFELTVAQTGLTESGALSAVMEIEVCHNIKPDKPAYMGGRDMIIKGIADKKSGRLLGAQIVGYKGVDKRIDVFATAITFKANVADLFHLDLAYSPPYSNAKDPVAYTGMILDNAISRGRSLITAQGLKKMLNSGEKVVLIDARDSEKFDDSHIENAESIQHSDIRTAAESMDKDTATIMYCNSGVTANAMQNILINYGFKKVYNLSGGYRQYSKTHIKKPE